ncbi:PfkB family carbohydrate kinase [soil metagenome]
MSSRSSPAWSASRSGVLIVLGDLVEDVVVWPTDPYRPGTDNPSTITRSRGGSAANVAACAASLIPTRFVGRVGDDATGRRLVTDLTERGVEVAVQRTGRTGTIVVVVDAAGERTMFNDRGASAELDAVDPSWLVGAAVLHVPAYGLVAEPMRSAIVDAARVVRGNGGVVSVDLSAVSLVEAIGALELDDLIDQLAPIVVFANREEAEALDLLNTPPKGGRLLVVKDGPRPAVIVRHTGGRDEAVEVPAEVVHDAVDTTGAGDAFAAGYLASAIGGADPGTACRQGHRLAAAVLRTPGAELPRSDGE